MLFNIWNVVFLWLILLPFFTEKFEKRACNTLFWSPAGQFIVLADLRANGILEFVDTNDFTVMNVSDHYSVSDVEWDPTGRYVVTAVSFWKAKVIHYYILRCNCM